MKKIVIFDFNRTLYDPDNDCLIHGARFVLQTLIHRGFFLYLVSRKEKSRKELIKNLGIERYFLQIVISKEKSRKDFQKIIAGGKINLNSSFVVGDRVKKEIRIGNALGMQTVWVKAGKFADEQPEKKIEQPTYTVRALRDALSVIF